MAGYILVTNYQRPNNQFWRNMKKLLTIFCVTFLFATPSYATGMFVGIDGLRTHANHEASNSSLSTGPLDNSKENANDVGYGVNFGVRADPAMLFASAEAFYERLESSTAHGLTQNVAGTAGPNINLDDRYGAKANLGITVLPWFTPFITYGVARASYHTDVSGSKAAPLYGVGLMFDLPASNLSIKVAYDMQKLDIPYQNGESETSLGVAHLGLVYNFSL